MSIEFVKKDKNGRVKFLIKNTTPAFANVLRRGILDTVPTMAIAEVELTKNSSILYDETIAHRLGVIVLRTDLKAYNVPSKCSCEGAGCSKCTLKLTLKAKGPGTVYASDLNSKDPKVVPVYDKTPIVKLLKGQELEFEATATLGTGKEHVKFSPALAWYRYDAKITVNNSHPKFDEFKDKFPPQIFKGGKIDKKLIEDLDLVDACDGINEDIVKIEYDPTTIVFYVEPWGQLTPKEIITTAADEIKVMLAAFDDKL